MDTAPAGFPSALVLSSAGGRTLVVGDIITDSAANKYLITIVTDQTHVTVIDYLTNGNVATGIGTSSRAYVGVASLQAAEDDIGNYASSGQSVDLLGYNDGTLTGLATINDTTLGTGGTLTVTSPVGERHTGTAGTGFTINPSGDGDVIALAGTNVQSVVIEYLEITGWTNSGSTTRAVTSSATGSGTSDIIQQCIIHDSGAGSARRDGILGSASRVLKVINNLIYDVNDIAIFFRSDGDVALNNTMRNGDRGIKCSVGTNNSMTSTNNAVFDWNTNFEIAAQTTLNGSNNATNDASDPGATTNNKLSLTSSDEFVDLTGGSEDYRLKPSAALYGAGADLSGTVPNDITGRRRSVPHAIGVHQNPRVGAFVPAVLGD